MQTRRSMAVCIRRESGAPEKQPGRCECETLLHPAGALWREVALPAERLRLQQQREGDGPDRRTRHVERATPPRTGDGGRAEHEPERTARKQRREPAQGTIQLRAKEKFCG